MHPALRKGPLFYTTPPPISFPAYGPARHHCRMKGIPHNETQSGRRTAAAAAAAAAAAHSRQSTAVRLALLGE